MLSSPPCSPPSSAIRGSLPAVAPGAPARPKAFRKLVFEEEEEDVEVPAVPSVVRLRLTLPVAPPVALGPRCVECMRAPASATLLDPKTGILMAKACHPIKYDPWLTGGDELCDDCALRRFYSHLRQCRRCGCIKFMSDFNYVQRMPDGCQYTTLTHTEAVRVGAYLARHPSHTTLCTECVSEL